MIKNILFYSFLSIFNLTLGIIQSNIIFSRFSMWTCGVCVGGILHTIIIETYKEKIRNMES